MIKVGVYIPNKQHSNIDLSKPEEGNPGIGGSEFTIITIPYYLNKYYPENKVSFIIYATDPKNLPESFDKKKKVLNEIDALEKSNDDNCDILLARISVNDIGKKFIAIADKLKPKVILRGNNTPYTLLNKIAKSKQIKVFQCVSREQYDSLRDHKIFYKSTYIFNGFNTKHFIPKTIDKSSYNVCYIGNIIPSKGFHLLAKAWPKIKKKFPRAKLDVIGSGILYGNNIVLGKWGIAEENYEDRFMRYLLDESGKIQEDVRFHGLLGKEKIKILQNARVGVPNPSGKTENCPASAIDFQACGTAVVTTADYGFLDTVLHKKTGLLGKGQAKLIKNILFYLNNQEAAEKDGKNGIDFINERFNFKTISAQWLETFNIIAADKKIKIIPMKENIFYRGKIAREILRIIKKVPLIKELPALIIIKKIYVPKIKRILKSAF